MAGDSHQPPVYVLGDLTKPRYVMRRQTLEEALQDLTPPTDPTSAAPRNCSPAQSIREGAFRDVLVAAKAFLAGG